MSEQSISYIKNIFKIFEASEGEVRPHFILTGPSGSGKSHTIQTIAEQFELPYFEINAASLTKEGIAGNSLSKALTPLMQYGNSPCVCFVDEFDKLFISGNVNSNLAHESTNGVQNEFLKVLEGKASVFGDYGKYHTVSTDKTLFIFAGAFNGEEDLDLDRLRELGLKTEFLGRVGLTFSMEKVSLEQMAAILDSSELFNNYLTLFPKVNKLIVTKEIMEVVRENYEKNTLGVRLLNTLIHQYFINGSLRKEEIKKVTFQKTLTLPA